MGDSLALPSDEVHVWLVQPDELSGSTELLRRCRGLISTEEQARAERCLLKRTHDEQLIARALVRSTLSRYADVDPRAWTFRANAWGRPELAGPEGAPPLRFNLAHTDGLIACAVAWDREIGVDVEDAARERPTLEIAGDFFSPFEHEALCRAPQSERRDRFFDYWTLKEAYIKARGMGLAIPLHQFSFVLEPGRVRIAFAPELDDDPATWQFERLRPSARHRAAVAIRRYGDADLAVVVREAALLVT
jgi:4'-phosphopantetheinyl transferase